MKEFSLVTLDVDGDGKMEVVIHSHCYEGEETTIYRCDPKKSEALLFCFLRRVIARSCGSSTEARLQSTSSELKFLRLVASC